MIGGQANQIISEQLNCGEKLEVGWVGVRCKGKGREGKGKGNFPWHLYPHHISPCPSSPNSLHLPLVIAMAAPTAILVTKCPILVLPHVHHIARG